MSKIISIIFQGFLEYLINTKTSNINISVCNTANRLYFILTNIASCKVKNLVDIFDCICQNRVAISYF